MDNKFIEKIKFQEDFAPFLKEQEIEFKGEIEIQNLIKFYLKSKGDKNAKENAKRFKINCVLGNNGGGKSRLFGWLIDKEYILNKTAERKNKYWDFYDLGFWQRQTQSYYLDNKNNTLNICDTINKTVLTDLSTEEEINKTLSSILKKDLTKSDLSKLIEQDSENKINKVVNEEEYLKNIGTNPKEVIKFSNILEKDGKIINFSFLLDDFFKLSGNIKFSENYEILNGSKYNRFYCKVFNKIYTFKEMYSGFLNIGKDFTTKISFNFKNWKDNYKGDYFDFINYNEDYNDDIDKQNVKEEIDYEGSLYFFEALNNVYCNQNNVLNFFGIDKEKARNIWLYLSELFLVTVNHFDRYMSLDDEFTKEMALGRVIIQGKKEDFSEKGLFAYEKYSNYKRSLNLLKKYIEINLEFLEQNKFDRYPLKEKDKRINVKEIWEKIDFNLDALLENLKNIEDNIQDTAKSGYIKNKEQIYPFKNIEGEEIFYENFIDKLQGSKYSSQSEYLLINLLFGYSDINFYTKVDSNNYKNYVSQEELEENKNKIRDLGDFVFDGPIEFASEIGLEEFSYDGNEKLSDEQINVIDNNFINCDLDFKYLDFHKGFESLSAGEKTMLTRFTNVYMRILEEFGKGKKDFIILIDEPDLHLHLDWQRQYIQRLIDVFSTLSLDISLHFILATHSTFIISDLPAESLVLLENGKEKKYEGKTFGANYIDLIQNGFFFKDQTLMGSFAEEIIGKMAVEERENIIKEEFKENPLKDLIGDDFLKDNLLYFKNKKYD